MEAKGSVSHLEFLAPNCSMSVSLLATQFAHCMYLLYDPQKVVLCYLCCELLQGQGSVPPAFTYAG